MVSLRRTPSGQRRKIAVEPRSVLRRRYAPSAGALVLASLLTLVLGVTPAAAQPPPSSPAPPPKNAAEASAQLDQVQREAEALTEEWHAAQDTVDARQAELQTMQAAVAPAQAAVDAAKAQEEDVRQQVDALATGTFESGNLDQFNALLASGSPQDFLDQMSALETLSADYKDALEKLQTVLDQTAKAQSDAGAAVERAQAAADEAHRAEQDVAARKRDAEMRIDQAERLLQSLTPAQRRDRNGPDEGAPSGPITGTGVGVEALRAAATQLGKPYEWGATGPNSYDCSGLTSWAFKRAGVTIPRSSSQQARVGAAVSWNDMKPGDLVFYYSPVSHVGIYAGGGKMINAPQTGDVVKYQTVSSSAFSGARRL